MTHQDALDLIYEMHRTGIVLCALIVVGLFIAVIK